MFLYLEIAHCRHHIRAYTLSFPFFTYSIRPLSLSLFLCSALQSRPDSPSLSCFQRRTRNQVRSLAHVAPSFTGSRAWIDPGLAQTATTNAVSTQHMSLRATHSSIAHALLGSPVIPAPGCHSFSQSLGARSPLHSFGTINNILAPSFSFQSEHQTTENKQKRRGERFFVRHLQRSQATKKGSASSSCKTKG